MRNHKTTAKQNISFLMTKYGKKLIQKLRNRLREHYCTLFNSYITNRCSRVKQKKAHSELRQIKTFSFLRVCPGTSFSLLYTRDISELSQDIFTDETVSQSSGNNHSVQKLQTFLGEIYNQTINCRNETPSIYTNE